MEIEINGTVYKFKASMAFMDAMEHEKAETLGLGGLVESFISMRDLGDPRALAKILLNLNVGFNPRLTKKVLDAYLEDETTDLEALARQVADFLYSQNLSGMRLKKLLTPQESH